MTEDCREIKLIERLVKLETGFEYHKIGTARALELQAQIYKEKMEDLNHNARNLLAVQARSVSQDIFDAKVKELEKAIRPVMTIIGLVAILSGTAGALLVKWLAP